MCDVDHTETYLGEKHVKGHYDSEYSHCQQSISKAQTCAVECGTILLDHKQAEKEHQSIQCSLEWLLSFVVSFTHVGYYIMVDLIHVILDTSPSHFSLFLCNIEKLGGPGDKATRQAPGHYTCIVRTQKGTIATMAPDQQICNAS